jgi:hypothetical protein
MGLLFKSRSVLPERMDVEALNAESTAQILKTLEAINTWLGGARATLWHLRRFSRHWSPGQRIRIIDWGTGGADIPRALVRWGRSKGFHIEIVGIDNNPVVVAYAREACREYPEISIVDADVTPAKAGAQSNHALDSGLRRNDDVNEPFDYALSSLTLHHLSDQEIIALLQRSDRLTLRGMIMNDLKRSVRAWAWIWALSRLGRAHPIVQYDGPLSVKRAFTPNELRNFARQANVTYTEVHTHFGYRLTLAGEKI